MLQVGSYQAKTHLPQLLKRVARGERIVITSRGKPVAMLVPPAAAARSDVRRVLREMKELRRGNKLGKGLTVRGLIEEGRRF